MTKNTGLSAPQLDGAVWQKSSYSGSSEGQCVECADVTLTHSGIAVRDSKDPAGAALLFAPAAFNGFIAAVKRAEFDLS
ncbi:DUF397 domain-containing protein [Streptomyces parvus]|uniref:DUF397 domain-containing protein n=1 Tax=Streptomyces parvus TaxID=66428 RepID=UPI002100FC31|nr:DUF397 domain-containing protein [Streptomyces parvus]MCQ1577162.1 DUF397 domain-containing protein [Streptomyces parvus]